MKKSFAILVSALLLAGTANFAAAQDSNTDNHKVTVKVPSVALLDIEPNANKDITLEATAPTEAGNPLGLSATNSTLWLNYTSVAKSKGSSRKIQVKVDNNFPEGGILLKVTAAAPTGKGSLGTALPKITLNSNNDQNIITGIGSCYTEDGINHGSQLTYELSNDESSWANLYQKDYAITVTYTLVEE